MTKRQRTVRNSPDDALEGSFAGQRIRITGRETIYLLIVIGALGGAAYLLVSLVDGVMSSVESQNKTLAAVSQSISLANQRFDTQHQTFSQEHHEGNEVQRKIVEAITEQNYIITRTEEQRRKLNLEMPESLRKKMRANE